MESYEQDFLNGTLRFMNYNDSKVLEIGCGKGDIVRHIAENYQPQMITGIDLYLDSWWDAQQSHGDNWKVMEGNAEDLNFEDDYFDYVISVATFEHIHDIKKALSEIRRVLKPGGLFMTSFGPVWSSVLGHHRHYLADEIDLIPPWGHLYMSESEMTQYLLSLGASESKVDEIVGFIYRSNLINRHPRNHLLKCIVDSGLSIREYSEFKGLNRCCYSANYNPNTTEMTNEIKTKLNETKYRDEDFGTVSIVCTLEKYIYDTDIPVPIQEASIKDKKNSFFSRFMRRIYRQHLH